MSVLVNKLEKPSNIISAGKYDNYNINYSERSAKIVQNSNSASTLNPVLLEEADIPALSNFNSNYENLSSSKKPNVIINSFNSTLSWFNWVDLFLCRIFI